jgi:cell division protein FtsQ
MEKGKLIVLEDRVPKLQEQRKQKANRRLILYLSLFFILILFIVYSQSSLSNVSNIEVQGNKHVSDKDIVEASGLSKKTSYWKADADRIQEKVEKNPEVKEAIVHKTFPNKVVIDIKEYARIAYVTSGNKYFPVNENGKVLKEVSAKKVSSDAPLLIDWKDGDAIQSMVQELAKTPKSIKGAISEIYYAPTKSEPLHIEVFMNDTREVSGKISNFSDKIVHYPAIASKLSDDQKGIIDLEEGYAFKPYKKSKE